MKAYRYCLYAWISLQIFYFGSFGPDLLGLKDLRPQRFLPVVLVGGLFYLIQTGRAVFPKSKAQDYMFLALCGVLTLSFVNSGAHFDTTVPRNKWLSALFNITYLPLLASFCARSIPYQRGALITFIKFLCILGAYLSFTAACEHYEIASLVWPDYILDPTRGTQFGRSRGPFMESITMGRVLVPCFGALVIMCTRAKGGQKALTVIAAYMALAGIYFTYTRGPWIGLGALLLAFLFFDSEARPVVRNILLSILIIASVGLAHKFSIMGSLFSQRLDTVSDRVVTWLVSASMISTNPWAGIGFGRFNLEWDGYYSHTDLNGIQFMGFDGSHNTYLTMGAEVGLPTLGLYCVMLYFFIRSCFRTYRRLTPEMGMERMFVIMVIGTAFMYVITSWFSDLRWNAAQNILMFYMFGLVDSIDRQCTGSPSESRVSRESFEQREFHAEGETVAAR